MENFDLRNLAFLSFDWKEVERHGLLSKCDTWNHENGIRAISPTETVSAYLHISFYVM